MTDSRERAEAKTLGQMPAYVAKNGFSSGLPKGLWSKSVPGFIVVKLG